MRIIKLNTLLLFSFLVFRLRTQAQITCSFSVDKVKVCLGGQVSFTPNPSKASNSNVAGYRWYYGDGATNTQENPQYQYIKPGIYQPKLVVYLNNGDSCVTGNNMPIVTVSLKPLAKYILSNGNKKDTQCYEGNNFCLSDISLPDSLNHAKITTRIILWDDGTKDSTGSDWTNNNYICHTYLDSVSRWRSPKLIIKDANGCIAEYKADSDFLVMDKIGARFTTQYTIKCDSTPVYFSNGSTINPNDLESFEWIFGDGTNFKSSTPPTGSEKSKYWNNFTHIYYKSGPFTAILKIKSKFGCIDQYTQQYAGDNINLVLNPTIKDDSMCWSGHLVELSHTPLFVPISGLQQVYWTYLPAHPNNEDSGTWSPSHMYPSCGAKKVVMHVWQPPCEKFDTIDYIMLYSPQATIENKPFEIADTERHQCQVINTVHFPNHSSICDAINLQFFWDFDDNTNNLSINDTGICAWANLKDTITIHYDGNIQKYDTTTTCFIGIPMPFLVQKILYINTFTKNNRIDPNKTDSFANYRIHYRHKNCNSTIIGNDTLWTAENTHYSYDWAPEHKYDTTHANERCHAAKFSISGDWYKYDTTVKTKYLITCNSIAQVPLSLMNPHANYLKTDGKACYTNSLPPYNISFKWDKSKPGCTQQFVSICFDSACCTYPGDPNCWTPQSAFTTPPWSSSAPWPNEYKKYYLPSVCNPTGFVTIGLTIHNRSGQYDSVTQQWCSDTVWFHNKLWFGSLACGYNTSQNSGSSQHGQNMKPAYDCPWSNIGIQIADTVQDSINSIAWNWGDGTMIVDSIYRRPYKRIRYEFDANGKNTFKDISSILADSVMPIMNHQYNRRGVYYTSVTMTNTDSCIGSSRKNGRVLIGNMIEMYADDSIICNTNNPIQFTNFIRYWDLTGPPLSYNEWNDTAFWADPTLGSTRPKPPGGYESFIWLFDDLKDPSSKADTAYHIFSDTGIYHVKLIVTDSNGCKDTASQKIYVNDAKADFKTSSDTLYCGQLVYFMDLSYTFGPCKSQGKCKDIIEKWYWDFGDKSNPSIVQNPVHQYSTNGLFKVTLIVKSTTGCWDTITKQIRVLGPIPRFARLSQDIGCAPFSVVFDNLSDPLSKNFIWRFNQLKPNGTFKTIAEATQMDTNYTHIFWKSGVYHITLTSSGAVYDPSTGTYRICEATYPDTVNGFQKTIIIVALRTPQARFFNQPVACVGDKVPFINLSDTELMFLNYDFGDGTKKVHDTSMRYKEPNKKHKPSDDTTWHVFTKAGTYKILFTPGYHICHHDTFGYITIDQVKADFGWDPNIPIPQYLFLDSSKGNIISWLWNFGDSNLGSANSSNLKNPMADYGEDTGTFNVCLYVTNGRCTDTICKKVTNNYDVNVIIPNSFTPDGDGINDGYFCETKGLSQKDSTPYELWIYNRWGELVFHSTNPTEQWNGKNQNDGATCPEGTYFFNFNWKLRAWKEPKIGENFYEQTMIEKVVGKPWGKAKGSITLIRR